MKKKIKQDEHGLYIQTNSNIYRPQQSKSSYICTYDIDRGNNTLFREKQEVDAHHISQTPHASIRTLTHEYEEIWNSHGLRRIKMKTTDCWEPR